MDWVVSLITGAAFAVFGTCTLLAPQGFTRRLKKGPVHFLNWLVSCAYVRLYRNDIPRIGVYDSTSEDIHLLGLLPSPAVTQLEKPQDLSFFGSEASDSIRFSGQNESGHSVMFQLERCDKRRAEVWMTLRIRGKGVFCLPIHPQTNVYNVDGCSFQASGLKFEMLEPMQRWRISFNGLLRKCFTTSEQEDGEILPVQFSFVWTAFTEAFDYKTGIHLFVQADALTRNFWNKRLLLDSVKKFTENRYEQWGQLKGTVNIEGQENTEFHLWGLRQHAFGNFTGDDVCRQVEVEAYLLDGTLMHVGAVNKGPLRLQYGHVNEGSGVVSAISWSDLVADQLPDTFQAIKLRAGGQCHILEAILSQSPLKLYNGQFGTRQILVYQSEFVYKGVKGFGWATFTRRNEDNFIEVPKTPVASLLSTIVNDCEQTLVIPYDRKACQQDKLVGGKGASLALLKYLQDQIECSDSPSSGDEAHQSQNAFFVPKAICVTANAYFKYLEEFPSVRQAIAQMEAVAWKKSVGDLKDECQRVVKAISTTQLSFFLQSAITVECQRTFEDYPGTFAVRSSAVGEDGEDTSAAGQNETYLGVKNKKEVFGSVVKCWASQFSYAAVEYKRQRGQLLNPGMAVVIQTMVSPDVAGVMFTVDPVNGNPSIITITANYGLGESVVSASAEPDTILIKRTYNNNLSIHSKVAGTKKLKTILKEGGGIVNLEANEETKSTICLSDKVTLQLGAIGVAIENYFGGPRDVEWAVAQGVIYLLQARPITSFDKPSNFELTHELDSPMRTNHEQSTKANTGEVLPNASTPLTISTVVQFLNIAVQNNLMQRHSPFYYCPYDLGKQLVVTHNHVLLNCIDLMCRDSTGTRSLQSRVLELSVYGHLLDDTSMYKVAGDRYARCSSSKASFMFQLISDLWKNKSRLQKMLEDFKNFRIDMQAGTSDQLYDKITKMQPLLVKFFHSHSLVTMASAFWNVVAVITLTENNVEWSDELYADIATLLSSCTDVESADVPSAMQKLVDVICEEHTHNEFSNLESTEAVLHWLQNHGEKIRTTFEEFLSKHGHRCLRELDLSSRSWHMDPSSVVAILQQMVKRPHNLGPKKQTTSIYDTLRTLKTPKSQLTKRILAWILPKYRAAVGYREQSKSALIKVVDQLRLAYNTLATLMVHEGRLPDAGLIFFLTHTEIGRLIRDRSAKLVAKAGQRKRLQPHLEELFFSEIVVGIPQPQEATGVNDTYTSSMKITGTPVCNGVAKGTARVVKKLDNASEIQAGDILITYCTDIGWSPYFPLLSGVVTEIGGILSHGAVVAREYGLPCIVGAQNATRLCNSGDIVVLNGTKGTLETLTQPN